MIEKSNKDQLYQDIALKALPFELTKREIDMLVCLLHDKATKKIALILSVAQETPIKEKTIQIHINNIMQKTGKHSRDKLVDYINQSLFAKEAHTLCHDLVDQYEFKNAIATIKKTVLIRNVVCKIACDDRDLKNQLTADLKILGIACFERHKNAPVIHVQTRTNYYEIFFESLRQIVDAPLIEELSLKFSNNTRQQSNTANSISNLIAQSSAESISNSSFKHSKKLFFQFCAIIFSLSSILYVFMCLPINSFNKHNHTVIRSDLIVPEESQCLERKNLINKITNCLDKKEGIQTVVLVGIGGAGKTTLARQYARNKQCHIVWEINAENKNTIFSSFSSLAFQLSDTKEEKMHLDRIKKSEELSESFKELIQFVKKKLISADTNNAHWLFIFDNINASLEIQEFLPLDQKAWGKGQVIITTRDINIIHNSIINQSQVICMDELNPQEKLALFLKIKKVPQTEYQELNTFIKNIPSFPLDVSIAAYYLKNTHSSYKEYMEHLKIENLKIQNNVQFVGNNIFDYPKSRLNIVACAIERVVQQHKDFLLLLFLISIMNHNKIPKDLLKKHSKLDVVNLFVHSMRQSSLINYDTKEASTPSTLSMHKSTQEAILYYLMHILTNEEKQKYLELSVSLIFDYCQEIIDSLDYSLLQHLILHLLSIEKHSQNHSFEKNKINFQLGRMFYHLGNHAKSKSFFEIVISELKFVPKLNKEEEALLSQTIVNMSAIEIYIGRFKQSKILLEKILKNNKNEIIYDQIGLASALMFYGCVSRKMGNYKNALAASRTSVTIYTKYYGKNHPKTAWAKFRLGEVYFSLNNITQAKKYFAETREIYQEKYGQNSRRFLWISFRLGQVERIEGKYKKCIKTLEAVYDKYRKIYASDRDGCALIAIYLADIYRQVGLHEKARLLLNSNQLFYKENYKEQQNIYTEWSSFFLGQFYTDIGQYEKALPILERSLMVHNQELGGQHIKSLIIKRALAKTYTGLCQFNHADALYDDLMKNFEKHFDKNNAEYACLLCDFGFFHLMKKNFAEAKIMLTRAINILAPRKHPDVYCCYEFLGDLYMTQGEKNKANDFYTKAFLIARANFPKNSSHIKRLKKKIPFLHRWIVSIYTARVS